jgi:uncharacterized BrkB/YihY/UPF0761 family membrane protein
MSAWKTLKDAVSGYIAHEALTRGAAIAFYTVTSLAPVLVIVVAIAGLVFGQDAVRSNVADQVSPRCTSWINLTGDKYARRSNNALRRAAWR